MGWFAKQLSAKQTVFFLHIPKCAGTSLTEEVLKKNFKPEELLIFYDHGTEVLIERLDAMSRRQQKKIKCLAGHFAFGVHRYYHARPSTYITLLRHPVERVVSHYYQVCRNELHYLHKIVKAKRLSLKDYLQSRLSIELDNGQTRILAGIGWGADIGKCPDSMLEQAKSNLDTHFSAVGISEKFSEFLPLLHREFGWETSNCKKHNVAENRLRSEDIDPAILQAIEKDNRLDMELYLYAEALFNNSSPRNIDRRHPASVSS